jgi:hypothetical protein
LSPLIGRNPSTKGDRKPLVLLKTPSVKIIYDIHHKLRNLVSAVFSQICQAGFSSPIGGSKLTIPSLNIATLICTRLLNF